MARSCRSCPPAVLSDRTRRILYGSGECGRVPLGSAPLAGDAVEVDQLAGERALVAHDRSGRIEPVQAARTKSTENAADGRERQDEAMGDLRRGQSLPTEHRDVGDLPAAGAGGQAPSYGRGPARRPPANGPATVSPSG